MRPHPTERPHAARRRTDGHATKQRGGKGAAESEAQLLAQPGVIIWVCFPAPKERPESPEVDIDPSNIAEVALAKLGLSNTSKMFYYGLADLRSDLRAHRGMVQDEVDNLEEGVTDAFSYHQERLEYVEDKFETIQETHAGDTDTTDAHLETQPRNQSPQNSDRGHEGRRRSHPGDLWTRKSRKNPGGSDQQRPQEATLRRMEPILGA
jgi:hypothetical protein